MVLIIHVTKSLLCPVVIRSKEVLAHISCLPLNVDLFESAIPMLVLFHFFMTSSIHYIISVYYMSINGGYIKALL